MSENIKTQAIIFSVKPSGKNNSTVCVFSKDEGLFYATMFGGAKSKLKSLVSPWNSGIGYFSKQQSNNYYKISDFEVTNYHLSFRQNLLKFWAASLAAEVVIKTKAAGSIENCWTLLNGFLDGLELCSTDMQCTNGLIRFLWRYIDLMGIKPNTTECSHCGTPFLTSKNLGDNVLYKTEGAIFSPQENSFICKDCIQEKTPFFLNLQALHYLTAITTLTPSQTRQIHIEKEATYQIKELVYFLIEIACNTKLNSLQTGIGIL